ncbi:hypothetical protein NMG60_11033603 [Bertholletia excelsa]
MSRPSSLSYHIRTCTRNNLSLPFGAFFSLSFPCDRFLIHLSTMGSDADMEDYGFEYSDEEPEEQDVDIENQYYNSKG